MLTLVFRRTWLLFLLWTTASLSGQGGLTSYTDRGKTDFDTAMVLLNPYGTWSMIQGRWAYTPLDHYTPYTEGQWLYTEYGWYWQGHFPHSWVTEHYGYWKRGLDHIWSWYPGPSWYPQTVELRAASNHIGWRSAEVDRDGVFVDPPDDRYAKIDEWSFVPLAQFAGPITPDLLVKPAGVEPLLEDSIESHHSYLTYRELDRVGPHPADFLAFPRNGMFAPTTLQDQVTKNFTSIPTPTSTHATTSVEAASADDTRQVKYWITMSLPSYWAKRPVEAKPEEIYLYRPDFYQDLDGINRRIELWLHPESRGMVQQQLNEVLSRPHPTALTTTPVTVPSTPALPVTRSHDPFRSPFQDMGPSGSGSSSSSSSKGSTPSPVSPPTPPSPPDSPPTPPSTTNAAPSGRQQ